MHQKPGIVHYLFDRSPDMEYLEILRTHTVQAGVGHYGVFSGRRWQQHIYPLLRDVIHVSE